MFVAASSINDQWFPGLGDASSSVSAAGTATSAASMSSAASTILSSANAIGTLAGTVISLLEKVFSGCGKTCVETSKYADQIEPTLQKNVDTYFASGRTKAEQEACLAVFDYVWAKLVAFCGSGSYGTAGQKCISDRQSGACVIKAVTPPSWSGCDYTAAGSAGGTNCWNWYVGYRDPIANDPCVVADSTTSSSSSSISSTESSLIANVPNYAIVGVAAVGLFFLFGKD